MSRADIMSPESRIVFEVILFVVSLAFLLGRTWVLRTETPINKSNSNNKISALSAKITGAALWLTICILLGVMSSNVWAMAQIIKYRDDPSIDPYFKVPRHLIVPVLKIAFALKFCYICGLYLIKAAFLGIFIKFLNHVSRMVRIAIRITIGVVIACFILSFCLTAFWCQPFSSNWDITRRDGLCSSFHDPAITSILTACNILTDLLIMAPPLLIFRSLRLQRRELLGMFLIFGLGMVCIITACVRLHFVLKFIYAEDDETPSQQNEIFITSELEVCIAIWAGCLPAMRTLIRRRGGTTRSGGNSGAGKLSQLGTFGAVGPAGGSVTTYITAGKNGNLERNTSVFSKSRSGPASPIGGAAQGYTSVDPRATPMYGQGAPQGYDSRPHPTHTRSASHVSFGREHKPQQPSLNTRNFKQEYALDELESPNRYSPQLTTPGGYQHSASSHNPSPLSPPPPVHQHHHHQQPQRPAVSRGYTSPSAPVRYPSTNRGGDSRSVARSQSRGGRGDVGGSGRGRVYHSNSAEEFNGEYPRPASQGVGIEDEYRDFREGGSRYGRSRDGSGGSIV